MAHPQIQPMQMEMHPMGVMAHTPQQHFSQQAGPQSQTMTGPGLVGYEGGNPIVDAVGLRFAVVPNVMPFEACCTPKVVQKLHVVPTAGILDPLTVRNVAQQVVQNSNQAPTPFTSFIPQSSCCGITAFTKGLLGDQTFSDAKGVAQWTWQEVTPCCRAKRLVSFHPDKREIGQLVRGKPTCGMMCKSCMCGLCCRSASWPEWAWLTAVDATKQPRLTFRHPATEGECLLCKCDRCCKSKVSYSCCQYPPDIPFHEALTLYGPMGTSNVLGRVDAKGAYGWDKNCGCFKFGLRPEMTTEFSLNQPLSFADTVLAMQMGLTIADTALYFTNQYGQKQRVPFLSPATHQMR